MSVWLIIALTVGGSLLLALAIVALVFLILRLARPADLARRPSTAGLSVEQAAPHDINGFRGGEAPLPSERPDTWRVQYQGVDGAVHLTLTQADSVRGAVRTLRQLSYRGKVRSTTVSRLMGDRSFLVMRREGRTIIAWTNAEWAFAATGDDRVVLRDFVQAFPY